MGQLLTKCTWMGLLAAALALTACGGGSSDNKFTPPNINETPVTISAANQNAIALSVDEGINGTVTGGGAVLGAVVDGSGSSPSVFDFASTRLLDYAKQGAAAAVNLPAGVVQSDTFNCAVSGTIKFTIDIADLNSEMLVVGDSFSITANNCDDGLGETINGAFSFTIDSGLIDFNCLSSCQDVAIAVNFNNFRITEGMNTAAIHGGFIMAVSETFGTTSFSGTSLFLIAGVDAIHLTNFDISSTLISGDTATRSTIDMTIASTLVDGSITIATDPLSPIEQVIGQAHPYTGTVVVTGAGGATLTIEYVDVDTVNFYLDPDGPDADIEPVVETLGVLWADM